MSLMTHSFHGASPVKDHDMARAALTRWSELKTGRSRHERDWEELARLIRPQRGGFVSGDPSLNLAEKPLSSAPITAQVNLTSGLYGTLTSPATKWMTLSTPDPDLNDDYEVKMWLQQCSDRILASFRPSVSSFYNSAIQFFGDIVTFGNACDYDEMVPAERRIIDQTLSLAEVVWDQDAHGRVNEVVRRFAVTARSAARMFGYDALPAKLQELADKGSTDRCWFVHHVLPNDQFMPGRLGLKGKAWASVYASEQDCALIRLRGYDELPFDVARWEVESGATCGTGPGFVALASTRVVQRMEDATIRAAQHAADPTKLAPDRDAWQINGTARPGAVIYGGVSPSGQPLIRTLDTHAGIGLTIEEKAAKIEEIRDAFNWSLMNLAGRTGMTATEVMTIAEERQRLMAPHQGRLQSEYLSPKVARRFRMLYRAGMLPPAPKKAEGQPLEVEYTSAAAMAQRSMEGAAMVRYLEVVVPLAGADPRYLERIDPDEVSEILAGSFGVPAAALRSREQTDKIAQARAEAQQMAQQAQMAQMAGAAMRDMGQAAQSVGLTADPGAGDPAAADQGAM